MSLLEIRNDNWELLFNDDGEDEGHPDENDVKDMIEADKLGCIVIICAARWCYFAFCVFPVRFRD